jgi:hypothetical protein
VLRTPDPRLGSSRTRRKEPIKTLRPHPRTLWRFLLAFARHLGGDGAVHFLATRTDPLTLAEAHTAAKLLCSVRIAEAAELEGAPHLEAAAPPDPTHQLKAAPPGHSACHLHAIPVAGTPITRHYATEAALCRDAIDSRVWAGLHFRFADVAADTTGKRVADWALDRYFRPMAV